MIMARIEALEFIHFVTIPSQGVVFACARDTSTKGIHLYLISYDSSWVKGYHNDNWYYLNPIDAQQVRLRAWKTYGKAPIFRIKGVVF